MAQEEILRWNKSQKEQLWLENHEKIRSYEVSIWTLQDDFITVLKHSNLENKGQIQTPKMVLNTDGTQELTFTIPMYLYNYDTNKLEENPIWYNTRNGNIAIDMRKIKVIFNKEDSTAEKVFEFLITKVEESHSEKELYCNVSCEGLAFHELGKIGYKVSLSSEDFLAEDYEWFKEGADAKELDEYGEETDILKYSSQEAYEKAEPRATINYWLNKFLEEIPENVGERNPRKWYYTIDMNYDAFSNLPNNVQRDPHIIYEESYVASWEIENNKLKPVRYEDCVEKERLVDQEESNIYNLTQNLAEAFGVFCKYEYDHDENYHIIGRRIIFYNNFIYEDEGFKDLTYPYDTTEISREMDSTDLATKMFVKAVEDDTIATGMLTIIDTEANNSGEDYLLNFEYLHKIGTISDEQYEAISIYEKDMKKINLQLVPLESRLIALEAQLPSLEAKLKIASNAIQLDKERIGAANDLYNAVTEGDGEVEITAMNPATAVLLRDSSSNEEITDDTITTIPFYINISKRGVDANSIRIFRYFDVTKKDFYPASNDSNIDYTDANNEHNSRLYGEIKTGHAERDEFGDVVKVTNLYLDINHKKTVFLTFNYNPKLYYDRVIETWTARQEKDLNDEALYTDKVNKIKKEVKKLRKFYNDLIKEKNKKIKKFEHMMGPALREGYWSPEDFKDCGDKYTDEITIPYGLATAEHLKVNSKKDNNLNYFIWDEEAFEDELNCKYIGGFAGEQAEKTAKRYPYIDLRPYMDMFIPKAGEELKDVQARVDQLSFFFCDYNGLEGLNAGGGTTNSLQGDPVLNTSTSKTLTLTSKGEVIDPKSMRCFSVGSQCQYGFIKDANNNIVPALILTDFDTIPEKVTVTRKWTEVKMKDGEPMLDEEGNKIYEQYSATHEEYMMEFIRNRSMKLGSIKPGKEGLEFEPWSLDVNSNDLHDSYSTEVRGSNETYNSIYPRMVITSLSLKTSSDQLFVTLNKKTLKSVEDYYCLCKVPKAAEEALEAWENDNPNASIEQLLEKSKEVSANYYITLKPEVLLKTGTVSSSDENKKTTFGIMYTISNADTAIYLDAKQILKENAWPRVSYTVKLSLANKRFLKESYNKLRQIVHVNDAELKFDNVMGYISQVTLNLDKPWEDEIEVKNYKTKFEDLFSTILASMNEMKKSQYALHAASAAFYPGGSIKPWAIEGTIYKADLDYAFNNGKLTIDEKNGIWGTSESGVVAIRGGGIFTSTEQDGNGNWKWNTGITPEGINATLITAGQLDTNRIMVYAGDKLRFQLNGEGLFAYKSFFSDVETINDWLANPNAMHTVRDVSINMINAKLNEDENSDLDAAQFVRFDSEGIALIAKEGALVLNSNRSDYINVGGRLFQWVKKENNEEIESWVPPEGIKRASLDWEGFTLRNYYNQRVLYADADTGNLNIKGKIIANGIQIGGEDEESSLSLNEYFGNPDALIIDGLTENNLNEIWPANRSSITVYYTTENDLINYLNPEYGAQEYGINLQDFEKTHKQGMAGDIWYNVQAPTKDLTLFSIKNLNPPREQKVKLTKTVINKTTGLIEKQTTYSDGVSTVFDSWQMKQIKTSEHKLGKALLGIYQANITGSKYNTIYKTLPKGVDSTHPGERHPTPIVEEGSRIIIIDNVTGQEYTPSAIQQKTWDELQSQRFNNNSEMSAEEIYADYLASENVSFRIETFTYTSRFLDQYEDIPLEEQQPDFSSIQNFNEEDLQYGDIWINLGKHGNEWVGIYRWESDYKLDEELLTQEGEVFGNDIDDQDQYDEQQQEGTGKWVLIRGISSITAEDSYLYDLTAAEGKVGRIAHGEYGLIFSDSKQITDIQLNKRVGLQIKSGVKRVSANDFTKYNNGAYFRVNSSQFGFVSQYKDENGYSIPYLYYEDGNLFIMGTIFAKNFYVIDRPGGYKTDFDSYVNFKFEDNVKISENLKRIFDKAGEILNKAWSSVNDLVGYNMTNASVLGEFLEKAKQLPHDPIELVTGDGANCVSALRLHPTKGIWMGSTNEIAFYSGTVIPNVNTSTDSNGASIILNSERLLFGVSEVRNNTAQASAIDIKKDYIVLASGAGINTLELNNIPYTNLTAQNATVSGVVIEKDSIGLATGNGAARNLILMDQGGIILGQASAIYAANNLNDYSGSFVKISNDGIRIGSTASLYIRTNNIILDRVQSSGQYLTYFGLGQMSNPSGWDTWNSTNYNNWGLFFDGQNLHIKGKLYANGITIVEGDIATGESFSFYEYFSHLFETAAEIIGDIHNSASKLNANITADQEILTNFQSTIQERLEVKHYTGDTRVESGNNNYDGFFKPGDYWTRTDGTYLAMAYSWEVFSGTINRTSTSGWTKINDDKTPDTLIGACMYQDAKAGIITMWASKGLHFYTSKPTGGTGLNAQNEIITTNAALDLTEKGIFLAAKNTIELGVAGNIVTDNNGQGSIKSNGSFSGLRLSDVDGIWLGTQKGITMFSSSTTDLSKADMKINPSEILFGVTGNNSTAVVDITRTKIIMGLTTASEQDTYLASGQPVINDTNGVITSFTGTAGMRIMANSFGLVTSANGTDNVILLNSEGIGIASKNSQNKYSGIIIRPSTLVMTTAGRVSLYGTSGEILFGESSDSYNFKVLPDGSVYCKRIYSEEGFGTGNSDGTTNSTAIFTGSANINFFRATTTGEAHISIPAGKLPGLAKYTVVATISPNTGYSAYFQQATAKFYGGTKASASFPISRNQSRDVVYELTGDEKTTSIDFTFRIENETSSSSFEGLISVAIYRDFKGSSTDTTVQGSQSQDGTYTVKDTYSDRKLLNFTHKWTMTSENAGPGDTTYTNPTYLVYNTLKNDSGVVISKTKFFETGIKTEYDTTNKFLTIKATETKFKFDDNTKQTVLDGNVDEVVLYTFKKVDWITNAQAGTREQKIQKLKSGATTWEDTGLIISLKGSWNSSTHTYSIVTDENTGIGINTTLSDSWNNNIYTVKADANINIGISTTLNGSWSAGTYTVTGTTTANTGAISILSTTPTLSLGSKIYSAMSNSIINTISAEVGQDIYYPINIEGTASGKYIKINAAASTISTLTITGHDSYAGGYYNISPTTTTQYITVRMSGASTDTKTIRIYGYTESTHTYGQRFDTGQANRLDVDLYVDNEYKSTKSIYWEWDGNNLKLKDSSGNILKTIIKS